MEVFKEYNQFSIEIFTWWIHVNKKMLFFATQNVLDQREDHDIFWGGGGGGGGQTCMSLYCEPDFGTYSQLIWAGPKHWSTSLRVLQQNAFVMFVESTFYCTV